MCATVRMQSAVDANTALPIKLVHPWVTQKTRCTLDWCSKAGWSCRTSAAALVPFWIFPANGRNAGLAISYLTQLPPHKQSRTWAVRHKDHDTSSGAALARVGTPSGGSRQQRGPGLPWGRGPQPGQLEPAPGMEHWAARRAFCWHAQHRQPKTVAIWCAPSSRSTASAWLFWQSSSMQEKPEFNSPSCHIPYASQNRILCSGNRFNTLGQLFQNKSTDPIGKQYLLCIERQRSQSISQSVYLSISASPIFYPLLKWIFICSQVNKGQSLLQVYVRLTPLDLPP